MEKFGKSQSVTRTEDIRFLTGEGRYIDDIAPVDALHGYVFRSPVAHGVITTLDVAAARAVEGVRAVLTCADLEGAGVKIGISAGVLKNRDGRRGADPLRPILAKDRVRFVGEAVAFIVAETLAQARDAAELIDFDYDELEPHLEIAAGGPVVHDEAPDNCALDWAMGDEAATNAAFDAAAHVVRLEASDNRIIVNAMEPRGAYAEWDGARLHLAFNGQGVWDMKSELADTFGLPQEAIRVTNPDVGGGFGMKAMAYPELFLVAHAARALGQSVRWFGERTESMLSDNAGRDLETTSEMAFDADFKLKAYRVNTRYNLGAYNSQNGQAIQAVLFSKVLTGTYDVQTIWLNSKAYYTNTTQVDAYRGAGRPEAIYVLERTMDYAARQLGIDPWELRRRNFIPNGSFPYKTATGATYDVGDFVKVLGTAEERADLAGFAARRADSAAAGKLRGIGLCYYLESILGDPSETTKVTFDADGRVSIYVGTQSNGQGHETVFAQFLSDQTGIPADQITVVQGDSDLIATGGGTGGSRSVTVQNTATLAAATQMITAFGAFLAEREGIDADAVTFDDEQFRIEGSNLSPSMQEAAEMARAVGRDDLLTHTARITLDARSFPNGAHVAEVEVDPETGTTTVARYTVVDDFGNLMNPMLAEGQVHGGVIQGLGQALSEQVVYDDAGQLLSATFMDYAMPRAVDCPWIDFTSEPVPSTVNPLGMKGCGEAGTVGALAAVTNAALDAMWARGVRHVDMPLTPQRVWQILEDANDTAA